MPLFGTLKTMALPDLLQWLATARMTGTLQVERDKVSKSIILDNGEVVGCSSDDPPELLGHFLLARGKITEDQLRIGLKTQESERKHLGMILVEMGALSPDELTAHLEAKAEETIYSLFDWQDAVFRFQQGESDQANTFPVALRVEDVLLRGLKRFDELQHIREVFNDPGIVLRHTAKVPPKKIYESRMARRLYESIDGERTVADILLHVHGAEYTVTKFLFELHRNGFVEIIGTRSVAEPSAPADSPPKDPAVEEPPVAAQEPVPEEGIADDPLGQVEFPAFVDSPAAAAPESPVEAPAATAEPAASEPAVEQAATAVATETVQEPAPAEPGDLQLESIDKSEAYQLGRQLESVRRQMTTGEYEEALEVLDELYRSNPGDESLRRLTAEAEAAFVEKAYRHYLPLSKIPVLKLSMEELMSEKLSPTESFLLSRIDGVWDLKSIIQIAPLREADALRTLKRMREAGVIDLRDPE